MKIPLSKKLCHFWKSPLSVYSNFWENKCNSLCCLDRFKEQVWYLDALQAIHQFIFARLTMCIIAQFLHLFELKKYVINKCFLRSMAKAVHYVYRIPLFPFWFWEGICSVLAKYLNLSALVMKCDISIFIPWLGGLIIYLWNTLSHEPLKALGFFLMLFPKRNKDVRKNLSDLASEVADLDLRVMRSSNPDFIWVSI